MGDVTKSFKVNISEKQTIIELSDLMQKYKSEIYLSKVVQGSVFEVNLKSFLGLINLQLKNGDMINARIQGDDSEEALNEIIRYLT